MWLELLVEEQKKRSEGLEEEMIGSGVSVGR